MTGALAAASPANCTIDNSHLFSGCGYPAPGLQDFEFQTLFKIGAWHVTKPELIAVLCVLAIIAFFFAAFAKPRMIPGRTQSLGEMGILAVRDQILRPVLGKKGDAYLPFISASQVIRRLVHPSFPPARRSCWRLSIVRVWQIDLSCGEMMCDPVRSCVALAQHSTCFCTWQAHITLVCVTVSVGAAPQAAKSSKILRGPVQPVVLG